METVKVLKKIQIQQNFGLPWKKIKRDNKNHLKNLPPDALQQLTVSV